ncbi:ubiquinol-cytochrome C chaperone family protein [uncultured Hyphomicrobium sp.]|uniref:ubiquinol-cytochrome C chaperone family protein n=1 Tax=uncultured Hyphomicrobium sp. TaxID=194373 RepID=UPI0025E021DB|nr:ubiquinol-cytochrome C chaperone family protein [uncultured Hyphomicrobium sp.]
MTRARAPALFARHGVLDTPEGRTSAIILLMFPLLERLQRGNTPDRRLARLTAETFVTDIDDCLREMGVGDLSVPKKVKRAAQALGERCLAYRRAAASPEPVRALADELAATVPGLDHNAGGAEVLARFTLKSVADLATVPTEKLASALAALPDPADAATASQPETSA